MPENDEWTLSLLTNEEYLKMHKDSNGAHQHYRKKQTAKVPLFGWRTERSVNI